MNENYSGTMLLNTTYKIITSLVLNHLKEYEERGLPIWCQEKEIDSRCFLLMYDVKGVKKHCSYRRHKNNSNDTQSLENNKDDFKKSRREL